MLDRKENSPFRTASNSGTMCRSEFSSRGSYLPLLHERSLVANLDGRRKNSWPRYAQAIHARNQDIFCVQHGRMGKNVERIRIIMPETDDAVFLPRHDSSGKKLYLVAGPMCENLSVHGSLAGRVSLSAHASISVSARRARCTRFDLGPFIGFPVTPEVCPKAALIRGGNTQLASWAAGKWNPNRMLCIGRLRQRCELVRSA